MARNRAGGTPSSVSATRRPCLAVALAIGAVVFYPAVAGEEMPPTGAEIRDVNVQNDLHDLFVSFRLVGAFSKEIREQIESGLPVTFNHYVEVMHRRPAWFDGSVVRKVVSTTVTYDTVTRQYRLTRAVDGEMVDTNVSDKEGDVERFMAAVDRLRLCDPGDLGGERPLYLRVKSRMQKKFILFFIPWDFETSWAKLKLTIGVPQTDPPR